jgi:hypothetical protein
MRGHGHASTDHNILLFPTAFTLFITELFTVFYLIIIASSSEDSNGEGYSINKIFQING